MKKVLVGGLGLVVLGYVGTTFYFGNSAEKQFKKTVKVVDSALQDQLVNVPNAPKMNLVVKDYSRGLVSASAKLRVKMDLSDLPVPIPPSQKKMFYDLELKVSQGPFILPLSKPGLAYVQSTLSLPEKLTQQAKAQLSDNSTLPQLDLSLFINFDESLKVNTSIPAFTLAHKQFPGSFNWKGMDMVYYLSKGLDSIKGQGVVKGMELKSPFANAIIEKMDMSSDMQASDYGLWVGDGSFNVPSIKVSARGRQMFLLSNWNMKSFADINNGLINVSLNMSLEKAKVMRKEYGPGNVDFSLKNLDAKTFSEIQSLGHQLRNANELPKDKQNELTNKLDKAIPKLVAEGAEIALNNVKFKMPEGDFAAALTVSFPKDTKAEGMVQLAEHIKAVGEFSVPMKIVDAQLAKKAYRKIRYQQHKQRQMALHAQMNAAIDNGVQGHAVANNDKPVARMSHREMRALAKEKVQKQMQKLIDNQIVIQKGANCIVKFTYDKGHVFVNGKPFSPEMLEQ